MTPILELRNVSKRFHAGTDVTVLSEISLTIYQGEKVAVVGASGSGKSTLLSILGTLERPSAGSIMFDGQSIDELSDRALSRIRARKLGFVFQSFNLLARLTAIENVCEAMMYSRVGRQERRDRAHQALASVGLEHRLDHYPHQLSGGEQQRVAIARALANGPAVILADEPTGNLDHLTGEAVVTAMLEGSRGTAVIIVTHDLSVSGRLDRQLHIESGRLLG
ncbi:MAG: putative transport system ATP-binding protein [Chloroflexota bacterium]|nr:putative transport system ATP-binding protein [Chloroflexota bacterium]